VPEVLPSYLHIVIVVSFHSSSQWTISLIINKSDNSLKYSPKLLIHISRWKCLTIKQTMCTDNMMSFFFHDSDWAPPLQSWKQFSKFISLFSIEWWIIILNACNDVAPPSICSQNKKFSFIDLQHVSTINN